MQIPPLEQEVFDLLKANDASTKMKLLKDYMGWAIRISQRYAKRSGKAEKYDFYRAAALYGLYLGIEDAVTELTRLNITGFLTAKIRTQIIRDIRRERIMYRMPKYDRNLWMQYVPLQDVTENPKKYKGKTVRRGIGIAEPALAFIQYSDTEIDEMIEKIVEGDPIDRVIIRFLLDGMTINEVGKCFKKSLSWAYLRITAIRDRYTVLSKQYDWLPPP